MNTIKKRKKCPDCGWVSPFLLRGRAAAPVDCPSCKIPLRNDPMVFLPIDKELNAMIKQLTNQSGETAMVIVKQAVRIYKIMTPREAREIIEKARAESKAPDLHGADLNYTNLRKANLSYADLSKADLRRATLCGAKIDGAILRPPDIGGPGHILYAVTKEEQELIENKRSLTGVEQTPSPIVNDSRPIMLLALAHGAFRVGSHDITKIKPYYEKGQAAHVIWFAIYEDDIVIDRINSSRVEGISYKLEDKQGEQND